MIPELMGINLTNRLRDLKTNIRITHPNYHDDDYYYVLGRETAEKLCMERGWKFKRKRKGHKLGKVWNVEVLYSPLIEPWRAYIVRKIDYLEE